MVVRGNAITILIVALLGAVPVVAQAATLQDVFDAFSPGANPGTLDSTKSVMLFTTGALGSSNSDSDFVYRNGSSSGDGARGGEFRVQVNLGSGFTDITVGPVSLNGAAPESWIYKTFCVEEGETFDPGVAYYATIDERAYYGTDAGDPLVNNSGEDINVIVKLGYALYITGQLDEYSNGVFQYNDPGDAGLFQELIWRLQANPEESLTSGNMEQLKNGIISYDEDDKADLIASVYVLNLWGGNVGELDIPYSTGKSPKQSQLFFLPPAPQPASLVPEPATFAIFSGMMLLGAGYAVKRRKSAK